MYESDGTPKWAYYALRNMEHMQVDLDKTVWGRISRNFYQFAMNVKSSLQN